MTTTEVWTQLWDWESRSWIAAGLLVLGYVWICRGKFTKRSWFFVAGMVIFMLAMLSPVEALANEYLFTAHMVQHMVLVLVVPPLWIMGLPSLPLVKFLRTKVGAWFERTFAQPPVSWILGIGMMAVWHIPTLCTAAIRQQPIHNLQYASLLVAGTLFIWPIASPIASRRLKGLKAIGYLFASSTACMIIGVYITYTPVTICPCYLAPVDSAGILNLIQHDWGMTPRQDQRFGGLTMWIPGCFIYFSAGMVVALRWISGSDDDFSLPTQEKPDGVH